MKLNFKFIILIILFHVIVIGCAYAENKELRWDNLYDGVKYLFHIVKTDHGPVKFYAVSFNLRHRGIEFIILPPDCGNSRRTASEYAMDIGAQIAINGGFWNLATSVPHGFVVSEGRIWPGTKDSSKYGILAITREGKVWISPPEEVISPKDIIEKDIDFAVSGFPLIVRGGKVAKIKVEDCRYICGRRHPRTAIGVDESRSRLFFVLADGRQGDSVGLSLETLAELMIQIGVWDGLNLDGGQSTTLYIEKKGGVTNRPCRGTQLRIPYGIGVVVDKRR